MQILLLILALLYLTTYLLLKIALHLNYILMVRQLSKYFKKIYYTRVSRLEADK